MNLWRPPPNLGPLFDDEPDPAQVRFDGADYQPERDNRRLLGQIRRVFDVMIDGEWWTLAGIHDEIERRFDKRDPEASISAQLRHLRKPRFGGHTVDRRHVGGGLYEYRLIKEER